MKTLLAWGVVLCALSGGRAADRPVETKFTDVKLEPLTLSLEKSNLSPNRGTFMFYPSSNSEPSNFFKSRSATPTAPKTPGLLVPTSPHNVDLMTRASDPRLNSDLKKIREVPATKE